MRLRGTVAIIAGASSGIGRAVANAYSAEGARLVLLAHPDDRCDLEATAANLGGAVTLTEDVADPETGPKAVAAGLEAFGAVTALVNVAGFATAENAEDMSPETWHRDLGVNLSGTFFMCQAFRRATELARARNAAIINTASTNAVLPEPQQAAYNAAKAGVIALTRTLAIEFAQAGIRVNAVLPGYTRTRLTERMLNDEQMRDRLFALIPLRRFADPEDIAPVYVFLASSDARYVTGAAVAVDGGLTAGLAADLDFGAWQAEAHE